MHSFFGRAARSVRLCATLVGTVIGAGFISGAELVRFFPSEGWLACVFASSLFFFLGFALLYRCGSRYGGFEGTLRALFGGAAPLVRALLFAASLVMCASMFAGLNATAEEGFGLSASFPAAALLAAVLLFALSGRGMRGVYAVNVVLVPLILAFLAAFFALPAAPYEGESLSAFHDLCSVLAYAGMNIFLAAPVICDAGAVQGSGRHAGGGLAGIAAASLLIGAGAAVVLANISRAGDGALSAQMPFLFAIGERGAIGRLFSAVCICGILTTLFSSFYPLQQSVQGKRRALLWRAALLAAAFALSLGGLRPLVRFVYPAVGAAGFAFLAVCAVRSRLTLFSLPDERLLRQRHEGVHAGSEHAQDKGRRHDQVKAHHLSAVNDQVPQPRL